MARCPVDLAPAADEALVYDPHRDTVLCAPWCGKDGCYAVLLAQLVVPLDPAPVGA